SGFGSSDGSDSRRWSPDVHGGAVPSGGPVGSRWNPIGGLGVSGSVRRADEDLVLALGGVPGEDPLAPTVDGVLGCKAGFLPVPVVDADLDLRDAAVLGVGDAGDIDLALLD